MGKKAHVDVTDSYLDEIATATSMILNTAEPADRAGALADALVTAALVGGDFAKAAGDTSGRKITIAEQADETIDTTGTATHVSLIDGTRLIYVTTCPSQGLSQGGTVTIGAWKVEVGDPT